MELAQRGLEEYGGRMKRNERTDNGKTADMMPKGGQAMDLFRGDPLKRPAAKLSATADAINARFGRGTVFFASEGVARQWKMKREMLSGRPTTRWNELMVAKA